MLHPAVNRFKYYIGHFVSTFFVTSFVLLLLSLTTLSELGWPETHSAAQAGLEFMVVPLHQPPDCCDYR